MNTSKVEICGVNTALLPVLNEEQKTQLLLAAKAGNSEARAQMIQGNLRLVLSVVQKFAGRGENLDDLFQVGCIGLIKAIDNFDPGLKVRFSTYAVPMITGEIKRFLRDDGAIKVGRTIREKGQTLWSARERLRLTPAEVRQTFLVSLDWLAAHPPEVYRYPLLPVGAEQFPYARVQAPPDYRWTPGQAEVPVYDGLPYPLWGLTARITRHVVQRATEGAE